VKEEKDGLLRAYGQRGKLLEERELRIAQLEGQYSNAKDKWNELQQRLKHMQERDRERSEGGGGVNGVVGDGEVSDDKLELQLLKRRLKCGVCSTNPKDTVISKCWHLFCAECVQDNLNTRHRKCPACGEKFGSVDVHKVFGLEG